jgi:hypothetical protein
MLNQKSLKAFVSFLVFLATLLLTAPVAHGQGPGLLHEVVMKGSIIEASPETGIYLCIGTADGAEVGQELNVVRITRERAPNPKQGLRFRRESVGRVRIERIVDEHFAEASLVRGSAKQGDQVELEKPEEGVSDTGL